MCEAGAFRASTSGTWLTTREGGFMSEFGGRLT
jgi:hypothetical protein